MSALKVQLLCICLLSLLSQNHKAYVVDILPSNVKLIS